MKVKELIELLKTMPQDLGVRGQHPDSGWPSTEIYSVEIIPDAYSEEQRKRWGSDERFVCLRTT